MATVKRNMYDSLSLPLHDLIVMHTETGKL